MDARPSDAISLALAVGARISVDRAVLDGVGFPNREAVFEFARAHDLEKTREVLHADAIVAEIQRLAAERRQFAAGHGLTFTVPPGV